jgi:hypothetical protein
VSFLDAGDPDLEDPNYDYDTGIRINSGWLEGVKVIFNSDQPMTPLLKFRSVVLTDADAVGKTLVIEPPTIFTVPAKIIIPVLENDVSLNKTSVYIDDLMEWVLACSPDGTVQDAGYGWMVPNSRENYSKRTPPAIEMKIYHTSEIQLGVSRSTDGSNEDSDSEKADASCFIEALLHELMND